MQHALKMALATASVAVTVVCGACSASRKAPDVSDNIRKSLDQAGLTKVHVSQDRDKGVVTLTGDVPADADKARAESLAKSNAGDNVVADEIAVVPTDDRSAAKTVNSDIDAGIKKNLDAVLVQNSLNKDVKYTVKNGVVELTGKVNSQSTRASAEKIASGVPNVHQVINELEVRYQRATSSR